MGLFDPGWRKILAKSPPAFGALMERFDPAIDQALTEAGVPRNGLDLSRNIIYSILIPRVNDAYGVFSTDALQFAQNIGQSSYNSYPKQFIPAVNRIVQVILSRLEEDPS